MHTPALIINFKTYPQGRGKNGLVLAKIADTIANEFSASIIVVPQITDLYNIAQEVNIPVYSQHIDPNPPGSATGHIDASAVKEAGAIGTLINHSERRLEISILEDTINVANKVGLESVVCAGTTGLSGALAYLKPTAIAMEPPELIGGDVSVTTRPEIVKKAVQNIKTVSTETLALVGAGVKSADHLNTALELGSEGVLLASGIVKHEKPALVIENMVKVLIKY